MATRKIWTLATLGALAVAWHIATRPEGRPHPDHVSESEEAFQRAGTRIVVLGAGFGGLAAALALDRAIGARPDVSILVIDRDNSTLFDPLLWLVADGRAEAVDVEVPIRNFQRGRRFHVLHAEVQGIDFERREVQLDAGSRRYDYLVVALGSVTELPPMPGLAENVRPFRTPVDAVDLRDHLIDAVEAAHRATDETERRGWLTFVVAGAGDTGVELAGALNSYLGAGLLAEYPWLAPASGGPAYRIVLVGRAPQLLPMADAEDAEATRRALEAGGIEVQTGTAVQEVRPDAVVTSRGTIPARTVFWAAGIAAPPVLRDLLVKHAKGGTLVVDDHLRLPEHPEVYIVGDSAWAFDADGRAVPPTAQAAEIAGRHAGWEIAARVSGGPPIGPFRFRPLGHLALIGPGMAIVRIGPVLLTGRIAWLGWHAYYFYRIPSWKRRLALLGNWFLSAVFGREVAQVRVRRASVLPPRSAPR